MAIRSEAMGFRLPVIGLLALLVLLPVGLILYQSFLDGPFFFPSSRLGLGAFAYVLNDADFYAALENTALFSLGLVAIAVPCGAALAFLLVRTDVIGRRWIEPIVLVPMFLSALVLGFGYTVAVGPSGFVSLAVQSVLGFVPWNLYSLPALIVIGGLSHVPYVYLYVSSAMRSLPADLEEAARSMGASLPRIALDVTLPLVLPALVFSAALSFLLGFESFGLPLVLADPSGILVLTTYLYKLTTLLGVPSYHLMAVVAVVLIVVTLPLVAIQRRLLARARRYATIGGKGGRVRRIRLGAGAQALALTGILLWLTISVVLPIAGIALRAFVDSWGPGVSLVDHLTTANFEQLFNIPSLERGLINTLLMALVGGALAVLVYLTVALAGHRQYGLLSGALDYLVLLPRALPGLIVGLAFFWVFLFVPFLKPLRPTLVSLLVAYIVVGLSYGLRMIQGTLMQVSPELEESARTVGAGLARTWREVTIPLVRPGLIGAWMLIGIVFLREYATGVYLMTSGTEVVGSLIVSLLASGDLATIAALSLISVCLTGIGLAVAIRFGARVHD